MLSLCAMLIARLNVKPLKPCRWLARGIQPTQGNTMEPLKFDQSLAYTSLSYRHLVASFIYFVAVLSELLITVNMLKEGLPDGELGVFTFTSAATTSVMAFPTPSVILQHKWDHGIALPSDLTKFWTAGNKEGLLKALSLLSREKRGSFGDHQLTVEVGRTRGGASGEAGMLQVLGRKLT